MTDSLRERMARKVELADLVDNSGLTRQGVLELVKATPGQLRGWLSGIKNAREYLTSGKLPSSNLNSPPQHVIDNFRRENALLWVKVARKVSTGEHIYSFVPNDNNLTENEQVKSFFTCQASLSRPHGCLQHRSC